MRERGITMEEKEKTSEYYRETIVKMLDDIHDPIKMRQIYAQVQWYYIHANNKCHEVRYV